MTTTTLPGGLELRTARPADLDQIGALLVARGEAGDDVDHRLVVEDPDAGWETCAVVVDGDRVVSTATLLDEEVRVGEVVLPAGQVELVATAVGYEGRGLVRALMSWAHDLSTDHGHLLQVMIGIPYFYRLFGYEYAIDIPRARAVTSTPDPAPGVLRRATHDDVPALAVLQDHAQGGFDVAMPHSPPRRRWLLEHDTSTTWVLERDGAPVATARAGEPDDDVLVAEAAATDDDAADLLLAGLAAEHAGSTLHVVHRAGTVTGNRWEGRLAAPSDLAEQYYVRVERPERVLDALRTVLDARLARVGTDLDAVVVSTFGRHYRMPVVDGRLGQVEVGGAMQAPGVVGGAGVAPDQLGALLLGPLGMAGLAQRRPDVYAGSQATLFEALFPPVTADLLTYYLPW
ncbi:GNAT family N-acetyltransferase [Actinotalea sp. AC32]|nr:GNAT family N-acetyltransferase [Actinotalea sp. AC32]